MQSSYEAVRGPGTGTTHNNTIRIAGASSTEGATPPARSVDLAQRVESHELHEHPQARSLQAILGIIPDTVGMVIMFFNVHMLHPLQEAEATFAICALPAFRTCQACCFTFTQGMALLRSSGA